MDNLKYIHSAMKMCSYLREDGTCKKKDDVSMRHCNSYPLMCCAFCDYEKDGLCDSKIGICTWLF